MGTVIHPTDEESLTLNTVWLLSTTPDEESLTLSTVWLLSNNSWWGIIESHYSLITVNQLLVRNHRLSIQSGYCQPTLGEESPTLSTVWLLSTNSWWGITDSQYSLVTVNQLLERNHWLSVHSGYCQPTLGEESLTLSTVWLLSTNSWWGITDSQYSLVTVNQLLVRNHWLSVQSGYCQPTLGEESLISSEPGLKWLNHHNHVDVP